MCREIRKKFITVRLTVVVHVDPQADELLDLFDAAKGRFAVADVVRDEVRSNLESVPYVRKVFVTLNRKEVKS